MHRVARALHALTGGRITPNFITLTGLLMHVPIALLIARGYFIYAGVLLIVFGLFDTLDGELARLQKRAGSRGMLLDASTDRMKEVALYTGAAYFLAAGPRPELAAWAVVACGASICVSYIKAKGETAVKDTQLTPNEVNRLFQDGLGRFEVRMFMLAAGLFLNQLYPILAAIAVLSTYTSFERLIKISRKLP